MLFRSREHTAPRKANARPSLSRHTKPAFTSLLDILKTDHPSSQVTVCLRGTMSIDDVATDFKCESARINTKDFWDPGEQIGTYLVHGGMLRVALAMDGNRGPLTSAINHALTVNPGYCEALQYLSLWRSATVLMFSTRYSTRVDWPQSWSRHRDTAGDHVDESGDGKDIAKVRF